MWATSAQLEHHLSTAIEKVFVSCWTHLTKDPQLLSNLSKADTAETKEPDAGCDHLLGQKEETGKDGELA
jgi:hypothetical protein